MSLRSQPVRALGVALLALGLEACSDEGEPRRWIHLAEGFEPTASEAREGEGPRNGRWWFQVGLHSGEGIVLEQGCREELQSNLLPDASLRLFLVGESDEPSPCELKVLLDGNELSRVPFEARRHARGQWVQVDLPREGRSGARLTFEFEGQAQRVGLFDPTVGPRAPGPRGARTWGPTRPDLVVFLADTFRADNLTVYGGDHGAAPELDRLGTQGLCFTDAWAPSSWTLPSQATLLSGLHPLQHGAVKNRLSLSPRATSLPEVLARYGYRTGAITDSGFVAAEFGLEQGFALFQENRDRDFGHTLQAALDFLDADDGRPVFLFIQTYRTHAPYRTGEREDRGPWEEVEARIVAALEERRIAAGLDEWESPLQALEAREALVATEFADDHRRLYLETVKDLDARFARFWRDLQARDFDRNGQLVFTSDHGEAFGEHGDVKHGGELWEEKLRIPLLLLGSGIPSQQVEWNAFLVDLPRTLAQLAGVAPEPSWQGTSLLELAKERAVFSYSNELRRVGERMAILDGARKIMLPCSLEALEQGHVDRAFDLARDPDERNDLGNVDWATEMARTWHDLAEQLATPRLEADGVELDQDRVQELKDLGY